MNVDEIIQKISEGLAEYGLKVLGAIVIFVVGRVVARLLSKLAGKALVRAHVDKTLVKFTEHFCYTLLLVLVVIAALTTAGVKTTSFIAVLGAAGLAVGLALQGSLANFAAGVLLMIFKPIKVGDFVEVGGIKGTVRDIRIFNTILDSPDNVRIVVPNAKVTSDKIMNFTVNGTRRVDLVVGVSYDDDLKKTKQVIEGVLSADERILPEPAPTVAVSELADSSVNFVVRPWVNTGDYWNVYFDMTGKIKTALDDNDISIPYPQQDIHIKDRAVQSTKSA